MPWLTALQQHVLTRRLGVFLIRCYTRGLFCGLEFEL
jgi:hypothetical protein